MRVLSRVGTTAGQVIDLPAPSARAMLADGRAVPVPDVSAQADPVGPPPVPHDPSDGPVPVVLRTREGAHAPKRRR